MRCSSVADPAACQGGCGCGKISGCPTTCSTSPAFPCTSVSARPSSASTSSTAPRQWYERYGNAHAADGAEGRLVSLHTFSESWDSWEMHPVGAELVACVEGRITLHQEIDGEDRTAVLDGRSGDREPTGRVAHRRCRRSRHRAVRHRGDGHRGAPSLTTGARGSGAEGNRTPDPFHAMEVLYQLSYSPEGRATIPAGVATSRPGTLARA